MAGCIRNPTNAAHTFSADRRPVSSAISDDGSTANRIIAQSSQKLDEQSVRHRDNSKETTRNKAAKKEQSKTKKHAIHADW